MVKTALVTGCNGFLGRHFRTYLNSLDDWQTVGWDLPTYDVFDMINNPLSLNPDLIVHCAARAPWREAIDKSPSHPIYNTELDAAMFNFALRSKTPKFLYISSSAVYDDILAKDPFREQYIGRDAFDNYGRVKRHGELLAECATRSGVDVTIVRPFSGYGSDQGTDFPFGAFLHRALKQEDPFTIWGSFDQVRDFIHVDDIVNASLSLIFSGVVNKPVNICTGVPTRIDTLAQMIIQEVRTQLGNDYAPEIVVDKSAPMGVTRRVGDPAYLYGWYRPTVSLTEGIRRAVLDNLDKVR